MLILISVNAAISAVFWLLALFKMKTNQEKLTYYANSILFLLWAIALLQVIP